MRNSKYVSALERQLLPPRMHRRIISRLTPAWMLKWLSPFHLTNEEGRGRERQRRILLSAVTATMAKCFSITATLISVPLTLHYLGLERYGMWMTMSSLVAMLSFADLGIGNGLLSAVAHAHGKGDRKAIQRLTSSAFLALSGIALVILFVFAVSYPFVPWHEIFNVKSAQATREAGPAIAVVLTCFALAIPSGVVQRVQMGLQAGFMASLWQCLASALALISLVAAIRFRAGLPWLALALVGSPLVASLANTLYFFGRSHRDLAPSFESVGRNTSLVLAKSGAFFLVLQIVAAITYSSDSIIIAQRMGAMSVAQYAVPEKMFGLVSAILAIALTPLWPAYSEAFVSGDHAWIRRTFRRALLLSTSVAAAAAIGLIVFGPWLMSKWVAGAIAPSFLLLLGLGIWKTVEAGGNAVAMYLNGAGVIRFQVIVAVVTGLVAVVLKVVLVDSIGISGAVWASTFAYLPLAALPMFFLLRSGLVRQGEPL